MGTVRYSVSSVSGSVEHCVALVGCVPWQEYEGGGDETTTLIVSEPDDPSSSTAVRRYTYVPPEDILLNVGVRVLLDKIDGVEDPDTNVHVSEEMAPPSGSDAEAPLGADESVGSVIELSAPAFTTGD